MDVLNFHRASDTEVGPYSTGERSPWQGSYFECIGKRRMWIHSAAMSFE
jgi:hypothetical protein